MLLVTSCKGQRFYWETKFEVESQNQSQREDLIKRFSLTGNLSTWHPVFGQYCSALPSNQAQLFVCWKKHEIRIISSYNGALKGDAFVRKKPATIQKYLAKISAQGGYTEHTQLIEQVRKIYKVRNTEERLLTYGRGSLIIKNELSGEAF